MNLRKKLIRPIMLKFGVPEPIPIPSFPLKGKERAIEKISRILKNRLVHCVHE